MVDPAPGDGSAEKIIHQRPGHLAGKERRERVAVGLPNDGRLQCLGVRPNAMRALYYVPIESELIEN